MITTSFYEFHEVTRIVSGLGTRSLLPSFIQQLGGKRVVLFSDKGLTAAGITDQIRDAITASSAIVLAGVFDDITQDAKSSGINAAVKFFKEVNGDIVIAVGGGSVIDTVKSVKYCIEHNISNIELAVTDNSFTFPDQAAPFKTPHITIPTTAGTGSEVSKGAVVYNERLGRKCNISHPYLSSNIAILDAELTRNLPPALTASTGMDALTHAVEALFSPNANAYSDALAKQAIEIILANIEEATHNGKENITARANMLQASSMAITTFINVFGPFPVHNVAHALGAKYHIPHGLANSVLLPIVMKNLQGLYIPRIELLAKLMNIETAGQSSELLLSLCVEQIEQLTARLNLPKTFEQYEISPSDYDAIEVAIITDPLAEIFQIPKPAIKGIVDDAIGALNTVES